MYPSFLLQIITTNGFPYSDNFSSGLQNVWSLFPPNLLAQALKLLSDATATPEDIGVSWSKRTKCAPNDEECVITIVCPQFPFILFLQASHFLFPFCINCSPFVTLFDLPFFSFKFPSLFRPKIFTNIFRLLNHCHLFLYLFLLFLAE